MNPKEMTFEAVFDALLLLWRRDYPGERLITDDGSCREFCLPEYEGGPFTFTRTDDPPGRAAPLANALVQLARVRSECVAVVYEASSRLKGIQVAFDLVNTMTGAK